MINYKKECIPAQSAHVEEVFDSITCDLCGKVRLRKAHPFDERPKMWPDKSSPINRTKIACRIGEVSYEDNEAGGIDIEIDLCPDCFIKKLVPWIKSFGGKPRESEWDN